MFLARESVRRAAAAAVVALGWVSCGAAPAVGEVAGPPAPVPLVAAAAAAEAAAEALPTRVAAAAQAPASLPVGTRVRVEVRGDDAYRITLSRRRESGAIAAWSADSLVLDRGARGALAIPLATVERIDASRGSSVWGGVGRGAAFGLLGSVVAALVAFPILDNSPGEENAWLAFYVVGGGLIVGPTVGAVVGASFPTERWERRR